MAEPKSPLSLAGDPAKINPYAATDEQVLALQKATEDQIRALEQRYAQPNWFNVAAGFAKPQLGGFFASLGSASQALGENEERRREAMLPIAQMRAQLAQSNVLLGGNTEVAKEIKEWQKNNPGKMPPPSLVATWRGKAPDLPAAKSLFEQMELAQKEQGLLSTQQQTELTRLMEMRKEGLITPDEYQRRLRALETRSSELPQSPMPSPTSGAEGTVGAAPSTPVPAATTPPEAPVKAAPEKTSSKPQSYDDFKITPTYSTSMLNDRAVTETEKANNARIIEQAKVLEGDRLAQWQGLQKVMRPENFATAMKANKAGLDMMKNDPQTVAEITELLRSQGPLANLLAGGLGVHVGPYGATFSLQGLQPSLVAKLSKEKRDAYDKLGNALAKSTYYDLVSRGIDPEKEGAEKFGQRMLQEANLGQGALAVHRTLKENEVRLRHNQQVYKALTKLYPKATAAGSITPFHDLYSQHPEMMVLEKMLEKKLAEID